MARILALFLAVAISLSSTSALWPLPKSLKTGSSALTLGSNFHINLSVKNAPADLQAAVLQTNQYLKTDNLGRLVVGRGSVDASAIKGAKKLSALTVSLDSGAKGPVRSISAEAVDPLESRDEAYTLTVPGDGSAATLTANSTLGLYRGLTTFGQLWYEYNGAVYTIEAPIDIEDAPAYVRRSAWQTLGHGTDGTCSLTVDSCWTPLGTSELGRQCA